MAQLLAGARVGRSGIRVVVGEAGIGKSTLLAQVRAAAGDMRLVRTAGALSEREVAFSGIHQICAPMLNLLDELPAPQRAALDVALSVAAGPAPDRFAVGAAVLGLITRAAEEAPLAIVVDDAHLLDESSAQALVFAGRRLITDRVALVLAMRPSPGSALADLPQFDLGPLGLADARKLLEATGGEAWEHARLERFHEATGGNPLALLDLAGESDRLAAAPPLAPMPLRGELLGVYARRARKLSATARRVLLLAAADSHDIGALTRACTASGIAFESLAEAEAAGLVRLLDGTIGFRHPLVRAAVYGDADPARRREAHRLLAAAVAADELDRRAWHLGEAALGPDPEAAALLEQASVAARGRGANAVAAAQLTRSAALTVDPHSRFRRLLAAGEQSWIAGTGDAAGLLRQARDQAGTVAERASAMRRLATVEARGGSLLRARDLQFEAAELVAPHDPEAAALLYADAAETCLYLCDPVSGMKAANRLVSLVDASFPAQIRRIAAIACGISFVTGGRADEGVRLIRTGTQLGTPDTSVVDPWAFHWNLLGPLFLREAGASRDIVAEVIRAVRERAAVGALPFLLAMIARDDAGAGNWSRAESEYAEAIRFAQETGHQADLALAHAGLAGILAHRGETDATLENVARARELAERHDVGLARVWAATATADLACARGDVPDAVAGYTELIELLATLQDTDPDPCPGPELVECLVQQGEHERAREVSRAFAERARAKGAPWTCARAHRADAIADPATAAESFEAALTLHGRTPDPFETARTQFAYGAHLRRRRQKSRARDHLRAAVAGFERLGATPWAERAAAELAATGETASRRTVGPIVSLTPQERQVASMLAEGRTTRETAAALFLSRKTVEYHLRNVYIKLDIHSRAELVAAVAAS